MTNYSLASDFNNEEPIRAGFGRGLKKAGLLHEEVVALCADLTESIRMDLFKESFPERFIEVGISEQNLITVASGLARAGKIPFAGSYAAFNPGRNWEQIKTTVCINNQPVKIIGCHSGINVGPDGATHQMLEDIAIMRCLPNMTVIAPGDAVEAEKATIALSEYDHPCYMRLARIKTPIFSTASSPFEIGKAYVIKEGNDVSLIGTGTMSVQLLKAAQILSENYGIDAEVVHVPTIKPLDYDTIVNSVEKTGRVVTAEEAQIIGGIGSAVAELLCDKIPAPLLRIGIKDRFGESGEPLELLDYFGLTGEKMAINIKNFVQQMPKYQRGF